MQLSGSRKTSAQQAWEATIGLTEKKRRVPSGATRQRKASKTGQDKQPSGGNDGETGYWGENTISEGKRSREGEQSREEKAAMYANEVKAEEETSRGKANVAGQMKE